MENAAEALKMAAAVLIFVLALSISIGAFGQARQTSQIILDYQDREYDYTYVEENKDSSGKSVTERWVGIEEIIPSIYKAYNEHYKIIFDIGAENYLYEKRVLTDTRTLKWEKINYIDLETESLSSESKREVLEAIIYGASNEIYKKYNTNSSGAIKLKTKSENYLYKTIGNRKLKEKIGIYIKDETDTNIPMSNKDQKRVITYSFN